MACAVHGFGQELGATINAETRAMKMPDKRVQAPMPVRYNSVRAGPHRPFCGGEGNDQSIIHAVYNAPQMYPAYIVELELQMEASVQACLSAEVEQAGTPAAKRQRTAGGASVGGAGASGAGSSGAGWAAQWSAAAAHVPATPSVMQLVEQLRSGTAATKAAAAGRLANMASQSGTERSGIVAADAIGPLSGLTAAAP